MAVMSPNEAITKAPNREKIRIQVMQLNDGVTQIVVPNQTQNPTISPLNTEERI